MLDGLSFDCMNPNSRLGDLNMGDQCNQQTNSFGAIPANKLYMVQFCLSLDLHHSYLSQQTWPTILGFSFTAKKWGEFVIDQLSEVRFDDTEFSRSFSFSF